MVKETVTYTDLEGEERTEIIRFNLSKAELIRMEAHNEEGLEKRLSKILSMKVTDKDGKETWAPGAKKEIFDFFEEIIRASYGIVRNGYFVKDKDATEQFMASEAYSELLFSLMDSEESAAAFVRGILPQQSGVSVPNAHS